MKYHPIQGMPDGTDFVIYGAASLRTGALNAASEKISVGNLIKLEMNIQANAVRVTIRAVHPSASISLLQVIKSLLS